MKSASLLPFVARALKLAGLRSYSLAPWRMVTTRLTIFALFSLAEGNPVTKDTEGAVKLYAAYTQVQQKNAAGELLYQDADGKPTTEEGKDNAPLMGYAYTADSRTVYSLTDGSLGGRYVLIDADGNILPRGRRTSLKARMASGTPLLSVL